MAVQTGAVEKVMGDYEMMGGRDPYGRSQAPWSGYAPPNIFGTVTRNGAGSGSFRTAEL